LQEKHPRVLERVASVRPDDLAITVISVEEQLSGWYTRLRRARKPPQLAHVYQRLTTATQSLSRLRILTFSEPAILRYEDLRKLKLKVGKMDLRIAAIVLEENAILATRNIRDFQGIPGLKTEDWSK